MTDFCSICLDDFKNPRRTQCGHIFCYDCIWEWKNEENYYGVKKETCPLCRSKMGLLTRVNMKMKNKKITKKKEPIKRVYRTRYKIAEERIRIILREFENGNMEGNSVEHLWNMSTRMSMEGAQYFKHNKAMRQTFNRKMKEFGRYDSKFLTLIKK
jgi:hypothetical protein|tara:strand:+ start:66 stop:533 length:468 start_codon:yes stop_codon:yes gene_type:complete